MYKNNIKYASDLASLTFSSHRHSIKKYNYKITPRLFFHVVWQVNNGVFNVRINLATGYANVDICSREG